MRFTQNKACKLPQVPSLLSFVRFLQNHSSSPTSSLIPWSPLLHPQLSVFSLLSSRPLFAALSPQPLMHANTSVLYDDRDSSTFSKKDIHAHQGSNRPREVKAEVGHFNSFMPSAHLLGTQPPDGMDRNLSPQGPSLPARTFHRQMPPGPLTARYGTWIMLRMAKPMLTRASAKARKRRNRIVTWRPALSSFTRCGKTGERRHSQDVSLRAWLQFVRPRLAYHEGFSRGE